MSRLIDADALMELLTTAIRNMRGVAKFIGCEDDPEIKMEIKAYTDIANGVKDMPTIEPEPKWIPCKECMPEVGDYVICSQKNGDVGEGKLLPDGNWLILYESAEYGTRWVTAWMPLPSAYREEGE